jgi:excinuclease UvrABC ATPase subunit
MLGAGAVSRRPYEFADIDDAILSILLDARRGDPQAESHRLADVWAQSPDLHLQIHPMLRDMATWGPRVPRSVIAETNKHLVAMGLGPEAAPTDDVGAVRATGPRFVPTEESIDGRKAAIRDAWALGGGYVELVDENARVRHTASDRLIDLDLGLVGPRHPAPGHFRRFDGRGRCPMCKGAGEVTSIERQLFVRDLTGATLDKSSFDPRAAHVLKGVLRSSMVPFFRRLAKEGLWDAEVRWNNLDPAADAVLMHGFWIRPGHGTFLRAGREMDGSEVNHWLRWDGMVAALDSQLDRSNDTKWRDAVRTARHAILCPSCRGAGLGPSARLLVLGGRSFDAWVREGNLASFLAAIDAIPNLSVRAARQRDRVRRVLTALRASDTRLCGSAPLGAAKEAVVRAAEAFSGIPVVWEY